MNNYRTFSLVEVPTESVIPLNMSSSRLDEIYEWVENSELDIEMVYKVNKQQNVEVGVHTSDEKIRTLFLLKLGDVI